MKKNSGVEWDVDKFWIAQEAKKPSSHLISWEGASDKGTEAAKEPSGIKPNNKKGVGPSAAARRPYHTLSLRPLFQET